ncbi:MAG: RNA-binding S4 domain-containing protein [Magnetococcales bacterium]|nr:RNA-binding S4 domain-containing protein [Magnetococcales bacterium]
MERVGTDEVEGTVRLDKWLWAARFFKTRSLACEAANGGMVHVNGVRAKPGRDIRVGDRMEIRKDQFLFEVEVLGLSDRRGPAPVAQALYAESEASCRKRELTALALRSEPRPLPGGRPTKKDRRAIIRFREAQG